MLPGLDIDPLPLVVLGLAALVLSWDVTLAGWIAARREAPVVFTQLTAFCGLLIVPAVVVAVASGTVGGSRTIVGITWLVPVVTIAFALQVLVALLSRLVSPLVGVPLLLYNVVLAAVACGDYLVLTRGAAPLPLQAALSARDVVLGIGVGRAALASPLTLLVPMIAPAYPARWKWSGAARGVLVLAATALSTVLILEWPRGVAAVRSYDAARSERIPPRDAGDFALGVQLLPTLQGPPSMRAWAADTQLVHALDPEYMLVTLQDEATRGTTLDSLAKTLAPLRRSGVRLALAFAMPSTPSEAALTSRLGAIDRATRRLHPEVLLPALTEPVPDWLTAATVNAAWWERLLTRTGQTLARIDGPVRRAAADTGGDATTQSVAAAASASAATRTQLAWVAARLDATDSAVYAWASHPASPVDILGATIFPSFSGLPGVDARLRALERWQAAAQAALAPARPHWLAPVGGLPRAHGDAAQLAAIRHTVAWGARRPWVTGVIIGEAADYRRWLGLRASNGRLRAAARGLSALR
ncbi:MAG: hypothetical protein LCH84_04820 [Gemmatimonadetes bacterium]|nr:hypothetical protein [Gemmatimonadota bacterium]